MTNFAASPKVCPGGSSDAPTAAKGDADTSEEPAEKRPGGDAQDGGVAIKSRTVACENTRFWIHFDHVVDDHGGEVPNYLVVTPKSNGPDYLGGVAILPLSSAGVGLVRVYRPALRAFQWEIPHGFIDPDEEKHSSALRELLEETGFGCQPADISSLGYITPDAGVIAGRAQLFVAQRLIQQEGREQELGLREFRFFPIATFEAMVMSSQIQDSFTLAAWARYQIQHRHSSQSQADPSDQADCKQGGYKQRESSTGA